MTALNYIEVGVCLAGLTFLLWLEGRRQDRSHLTGRVAATLLAVAALAGMILPLAHRRPVSAAAGMPEGIYLTEGYDVESVRQFLGGHPDIRDLWGEPAVVGNVVPAAPEGLKWPVSRLHVFGYGLTGRQWAALHPPGLVFHPGSSVGGVIAVDWRRSLFAGERLLVQGRWQGAGVRGGQGRRPVKLLLMGLGMVLDSADAGGDFSLGTVPAQTGRAVYRLVALAGRDTLEQEDIPVEVGHGRPLRILILADAPGFENNFLLNWLAKNGQQAAIRTKVSSNTYQSSYVNMPPRSLETLTSSLLNGFDILIADSSALPAAGDAGRQILRREVEEEGMGLIIRIDSGYVHKKAGMRSFETDSLSRVIVGGGPYGVGKVIYTTVNTTYVRMMAGQSAVYAAYWSSLLRRAGRMAEARDEWTLMPAQPRVGEETDAVLEESGAGQPLGLVGASGSAGLAGDGGGNPVSLYFAQDDLLPFIWRGRYWPEGIGWHNWWTSGGDTVWSYVWPRGAWASL
jgi:hypothetical protein